MCSSQAIWMVTIEEQLISRWQMLKDIKFDENNICSACNFNQLKWNNVIDWKEREKELVELCNEFRKNDGSYDCIVGGSGDKDSVFQSHILKYNYGMHLRFVVDLEVGAQQYGIVV